MSLNFFETTIKLRLDKSSNFGPRIGLILSAVLTIVSILAFFAFGIDIILKEKPAIVTNTIFNQNRNYELPKNFTSFGFFFQGKAVSDFSRYFQVYALHQDANPDYLNDKSNPNLTGHINNTIYPMEKCSLDDIAPEIQELAVDGPVTERLCWPKQFPTIMRNSWGEANGAFPQLVIAVCKNTTDNNNFCASNQEITSMYSAVTFNLFFWDTYIDGYDWGNPGKVVVYKFFSNFAADSFRRTVFNMRMKSFTTDEGWIIQSNRNQNYISFDSVDTTVVARNRPEILNLIFGIYRYQDSYFRKYIKIQEVFAYIGGFFSLFYKLLLLAYNYLTEPDILANFWTKIRSNKKQIKAQVQLKDAHMVALPDNSKVFESGINNYINPNNKQDIVPNPKVVLPSKLQLSFCQKVFRSRGPNSKFYSQIENLWKTILSVDNIGNMYLRLNKLEYGTLSEDQYVSLDQIKKIYPRDHELRDIEFVD